MPNPKRRHSQQRSAKRRTHYKAVADTITVDSKTGEAHLRHRAHWSENKLIYKGQVVMEKPTNTK
ncbi:MAG: 50S ribosomal protein L32 [Chitinophagaceae bacterium]